MYSSKGLRAKVEKVDRSCSVLAAPLDAIQESAGGGSKEREVGSLSIAIIYAQMLANDI